MPAAAMPASAMPASLLLPLAAAALLLPTSTIAAAVAVAPPPPPLRRQAGQWLGSPEGWEARPSSGCGGSGPKPDPDYPGWYRLPLTDPVVGPVDRWYVLHVPESYDPNIPTPLVLDIHGYSSNAKEQSERTWLDRVADQENFIIAYPDGMDDTFEGDGEGEKGWNAVGTTESPGLLGPTCPHPPPNASWYSCHKSCKHGPGHHPPGAGRSCYRGDAPPHQALASGCDCSSCVDDVFFISQLVEVLVSSMCVERRRIHATGFSNGAMMVYQVRAPTAAAPAPAPSLCPSPKPHFWFHSGWTPPLLRNASAFVKKN
jgi:hypothetical protein